MARTIEKDSRVIRYYGIHELPRQADTAKWLRITVNLERVGSNEYVNVKTEPSRKFHGYIELCRGGNVVKIIPYEFDNQQVLYIFNNELFLHTSISCSLEAILTTFVNFAIALNFPPIERINPIKDYVIPLFSDYFDQVRYRLRQETMVCTSLIEWEKQEICSVPESTPPNRPPTPPAPPKNPKDAKPADAPDAEVPPTAPPYRVNDDDHLTYKPNPEPLPTYPACTAVVAVFNLEEVVAGQVVTRSQVLTAPVTNLRLETYPGDGVNELSWLVDQGEEGNPSCPKNTVRLSSTFLTAAQGSIVSLTPL